MKRTPMEMSCYRLRDRGSKLRNWDVMRGDILFGKRGMGSRVRIQRKKLIKEMAKYKNRWPLSPAFRVVRRETGEDREVQYF